MNSMLYFPSDKPMELNSRKWNVEKYSDPTFLVVTGLLKWGWSPNTTTSYSPIALPLSTTKVVSVSAMKLVPRRAVFLIQVLEVFRDTDSPSFSASIKSILNLEINDCLINVCNTILSIPIPPKLIADVLHRNFHHFLPRRRLLGYMSDMVLNDSNTGNPTTNTLDQVMQGYKRYWHYLELNGKHHHRHNMA